jgi:Oxidoreductase family, NAD-binding Rossmann fold
MNNKVKWGVLGVSDLAVKKVIPAMRRGEWSQVAAIASRDLKKAQQAAERLGIPKAYGSYEELVADPNIEAIYNPLPNHLHVPWSIKAAEAGKHVLCEKPISLTAAEAISLLKARDRTGVKIEEAFMVRTHPQWRRVLDLIRAGRIGPVRSFLGCFTYYNRDPKNIRNILEYGGGALMDIGCWGLHFATCIWRRTDACARVNRRGSGDANRCGDLSDASFSFWTMRIYLWHPACTLPAGADLGDSGADRGRDTIKCSAGSALPYIYRRRSRSLRSQCGDLGIRDLRSIYDPRRPVFAKHSPGYGVARSLRGLCPKHGGNRSDFPISQIG